MNQPPTDWRTVRRTLQTMRRSAAPCGAEAFWRDFDARRMLRPQRRALASERSLPLFLVPLLAAAGVAMLLLGGFLLARMGDRHTLDGGRMEGQVVAILTDEFTPAIVPAIRNMELNDEEEI